MTKPTDQEQYLAGPKDDLAGRAVRGVGWMAGSMALTRISQFVVFLVLARLLVPEDFGLVAMAMVFIALLGPLVEQGFGMALVQREKLEPEHLDAVFWWSLGSSLILTAGLWLTAGWIADLYGATEIKPILQALAFAFPLRAGLGSVPQALLQRTMAYRVLGIRRIISDVAGGAMGIGVALAGGGAWALVAQQLTVAVANTATSWLAVSWRPHLKFSWSHLRELLIFSANILGKQFIATLGSNLVNLLVGSVLGATPLGFFVVAQRFPLTIHGLTSATLQSIGFTAFSRAQTDLPRIRRGYYRAQRMTCTLTFPIMLMMAIMAKDLVMVCFGEQWAASIPLVPLFAFTVLLGSITALNLPLIDGLGQPHLTLLLAIINTALSALAALTGTAFGIFAVAFGCMTRNLIILPISSYLVKKIAGIRWQETTRSLTPATLSGAIMTLTIFKWLSLVPQMEHLPRLCIGIVIGVSVYLVMLGTFWPALLREFFELIRNVVRAKLR